MRRVRELDEALERCQLQDFFPPELRYCLGNDDVKTSDLKDKPKLLARAVAELPAADRTWMVGGQRIGYRRGSKLRGGCDRRSLRHPRSRATGTLPSRSYLRQLECGGGFLAAGDRALRRGEGSRERGERGTGVISDEANFPEAPLESSGVGRHHNEKRSTSGSWRPPRKRREPSGSGGKGNGAKSGEANFPEAPLGRGWGGSDTVTRTLYLRKLAVAQKKTRTVQEKAIMFSSPSGAAPAIVATAPPNTSPTINASSERKSARAAFFSLRCKK